MKTSIEIACTAVALIGTLGFSGLMGTVSAKQPQSVVAIMPEHRTNTRVSKASDGDGEANDATEVPENAKNSQSLAMNESRGDTKESEAGDGDGETNDDTEDQQEADQLQSLAKITAQEALQAAQSTVAGKATSIELENEDGNLVYAVEIGQQEVIVDAGNGRVLYTENATQEDEKNQASRPKSSIQVPNTNGSDYGSGQLGG